MDLNKTKQAINMLSKLIDDNEQISLHTFAAKLSNASAVNPQDQTIGVMADVLSRMTSQKKLFISRAEIKDLYKKLYSRNTKFAELFQAELGVAPTEPNVKIYNRDFDDRDGDILTRAFDAVVDPVLANALGSAFGNEVQSFNKEIAEKAKKVCKQSCETAMVDIVNGTDSFILCKASFETPKGKVSIYVPMEISAGKVLLPEVFIGNDNPQVFSKKNIQKYIVANIGKKSKFDEKTVFAALNSLKNKPTEISNVDLAVIKLNSQKDSKAELFSTNAILMQKVAEFKNNDVKTPEFKDNEIESFVNKFDSTAGAASFDFGDKIINTGKTVISNKLNNIGLNNYQISVCDSNKISITYAVSANAGKVAFKVPVKVQSGKIIDPEVVISNGFIESFSNEGFKSIIKRDLVDYKTAAVASPLYDLKASELVQIVRTAMEERNYVKAEDALNILSLSDDIASYKTAFTEYNNGLSQKQAEPVSKCSNVIKNAYSSHPLCAHTGLPLHKVFQDKHGNCSPKYRQDMTANGTINSKIF